MNEDFVISTDEPFAQCANIPQVIMGNSLVLDKHPVSLITAGATFEGAIISWEDANFPPTHPIHAPIPPHGPNRKQRRAMMRKKAG